MSLLNWIFDIYQHTQVSAARDDAARARAEAASLRAQGGGVDVAHLEQALGELALAAKTVQRLLVEKGVCTQQELADAMHRIDLEDGRADRRTPLR